MSQEFTGVVVAGDGRGRVLGFPTANLALAEGELPDDGVYAAWARLDDGEIYGASVSVGNNPTFRGERARRIEVYLHDVDLDLYGRQLSLELVGSLRDNIVFGSVADLVAQTERDVQTSRTMLAGLTRPQ